MYYDCYCAQCGLPVGYSREMLLEYMMPVLHDMCSDTKSVYRIERLVNSVDAWTEKHVGIKPSNNRTIYFGSGADNGYIIDKKIVNGRVLVAKQGSHVVWDLDDNDIRPVSCDFTRCDKRTVHLRCTHDKSFVKWCNSIVTESGCDTKGDFCWEFFVDFLLDKYPDTDLFKIFEYVLNEKKNSIDFDGAMTESKRYSCSALFVTLVCIMVAFAIIALCMTDF